ncbi:hypothetical protein DFH29DRAFT_983430 [Suillus ampliporus]|nr:hypothetical protein DFH29DRAFT_983430 [Suillus ampliporus]
MEHWPADERQKALPVKKQGRGNKRLQAHNTHWNHPSLDYGTLGGATLVSSDGQLAWTTVVDTSNARRVTPVEAGHCIFPATRPLNFVRTCFPDADFPTELVKAEFQADERQHRELQVYDPLRGNLLSIVPSSSIPQTSLVLFPVGETNNELILVRTLSATSLLSIETSDERTDVKATREVDILSDDAGGKSAVDVTFSPHHSDIIVVNTSGAVYNCSIYQGAKAMRRIGPNQVRFENTNEDKFWRLRTSDQGYFLASSSCIQHLDFRRDRQASLLLTYFPTDQLGPVVTSFDRLEQEHLLTISTTSELIWLDDRYPKKTLLSFKHNRAHDRSLNVRAVQLDSGPLTFLSSLKNELVTIYDVSRGDDNLIHCHSVPTSLPQDGDIGAPDSESTFVVRPDMSTFSLLRLSGQGSLHCQDFTVCRNDVDILRRQTVGTGHEWSADVQKLAQRAKELQPLYGPLSARHFSELNLRTAYQKIFFMGDATEQAASEGKLIAMVDRLSQFWQRAEDTDNAMHDVCLRADGEPNEGSRADFLVGGLINSNRGYKALVRNELPVQEITSGAAWRCDFKPFLRRMGLGRVDHWQEMHDALEVFNLSYSNDAPELFVQQEEGSREQLILDLSLSSMVFSPQPVSMPAAPIQVDDVETMSLAAKALTLNDELPDIQFGYLRPYRTLGINHYPHVFKDKDAVAEPDQDADFSTPLGVRLLLREWEVGTDVESYAYRDPYNTEGDNPVAPSRERALPTAPVATQTRTTTSQRPPLIVAGFDPRPPPIHPAQSHWGRSGTQPQGFTLRTTDIQNGNYPEPSQPSQELMTSTQVLPGPYGGRNAPMTKKLVKKRLARGSFISCSDHSTCCKHVTTQSAKSVFSTPINPWFNRDAFNDVLKRNKPVVCALSASYISTFVGYPLDSLKSRLQTTKTRMPVLKLAGIVYGEEGVAGFYRGLWIPLVTISFVRAASFTIYSSTKEYCRKNNYFTGDRASDAALAGGLSGALSGSLISCTSAPFELVKVRRQLEYSIAASKGIQMVKPPNTVEAVREIFRTHGLSGLWIGFRLHFLRDTTGTAFARESKDQRRAWLPIPTSLIPFVCGSLAGVSSWALIYPLDVVKTKVQQRALAGTPPKGVWETLRRLHAYIAGLGVSALRSITTHGLLWTFFDITSHYIDHLP